MWFETLESARAKAKDKNVSNYLQLATYDAVKGVSVRTMVFRGLSHDHQYLSLATDQRSRKLVGISKDNRAQIAWYLTDARMQFRFSGHLLATSAIEPEQSAREELWNSLSFNSRLSFFADAGGNTDQKSRMLAESGPPPSSFVLLQMRVKEVEVLDLNTQPHKRLQFSLHGEAWSQQAIDLN